MLPVGPQTKNIGSQALRWRMPGTGLGATVPSDVLLGC
jgi:hypothetical protein